MPPNVAGKLKITYDNYVYVMAICHIWPQILDLFLELHVASFQYEIS